MKLFFRLFSLLFILTLTACGGGGDEEIQVTGGGGQNGGEQVAGGSQNSMAARSAPLAANDAACPTGGVLVETGIDENGNGFLDTDEVDQSEKVCNGATGADGAAGANGIDGLNGTNGTDSLQSLVLLSDEPIGPNCSFGGVRIDSGLDTNKNGTLDAPEIADTKFVCTPARALFEAKEKLLALDANSGDGFGGSISISGDYAIVGAKGDDAEALNAGAAYIYRRTGPNTWDSGTKIVAQFSLPNGAEFGHSVSISGDYAIVGARLEIAGGPAAGAAYIYRRTGLNTWDGGTRIISPFGPENFAEFGFSVSISGDYAIVGERLSNVGSPDTGRAYIYRRTGLNAWDDAIHIFWPETQSLDQFGFSVSISGDYAIVGANFEDEKGTDAGAAYIFRRTGTNSWTNKTKITARNPGSLNLFGSSVSISGDTAIVGANKANGTGAAYIYQRTGLNTWDVGTKIRAPDAEGSDDFGNSVSISGDTTIVGARLEDEKGTSAGAAYVYQRTGPTTWDAGTKITAPDAESLDLFGSSVSISGETAIVGARGESTGGFSAGAAYIVR